VINGIAAHICAASVGGPRHDPEQTSNERASISNAIWLCASCASLIDKNNGHGFSVKKLHQWKADAEQQSHEALLSNAAFRRPVWLDRLSTIHFANVPRLAQMLAKDEIPDWLIQHLRDGFPSQGMIVRELVAVDKAVEVANVEAIPLEDVLPPSNDIIGTVISFHHTCYTKNGVGARSKADEESIRVFDQQKSPHFYIKSGGAKFFFPYDPRWVTTTTAYTDFSAGRVKFAGLGIVKRVSEDSSEVIVSPLLVGLPRHPSWDIDF